MRKLEQLRKNLFTAIDEHDLEKVKKCVKKAREINKKNEIINGEMDGIRPIHRAVYADNLKALRFLLHNGADINAMSNMCFSPFVDVTTTMNNEIEETVHTNNEIKKIVHDHCSSTSPREMQGFTALHLALFYCRLDIVKTMIHNNRKHNLDINIKNMNNATAFDVTGGYYNFSRGSYKMKEVLSITATNVTGDDCKAKLTSKKASIKIRLGANCVTDSASSAVKPSSFINSIFNGITTTISGLFSSAPALPSAHQSVAYSAGSPIGSSQIDCNGIATLIAMAISYIKGKQYLRPLDNSPLTIEEIRVRKLDIIEKNVKTAHSECKKRYQCPESSLSNSTVSRFASSKVPLNQLK